MVTYTRGLLVKDHVILNHGQKTWTAPEQALPLQIATPHQREDVSALERFNVHCCPKRRALYYWARNHDTHVMIRYLDYWATAAHCDYNTFEKHNWNLMDV
ncbi:uncharacterized protein TNCV_4521981 [Trichonephila clavipes]|nr:uncharacterized protein TNCV_4521981 [Trichonephila clavipes]